jgi:hypothetical protein
METLRNTSKTLFLPTMIMMMVLVSCSPLFDAPLQDKSDWIIKLHTQSSQVVYVVVDKVDTAPEMWTGSKLSYQNVDYIVKETLKGDMLSGTITVRHPVVKESVTALTTEPGLSTTLFKIGNPVILFLQTGSDGLETFDEDYGVIAATPKNISAIKGL